MVETFQEAKADCGSSVMAAFMESNALYSGIRGAVAAKEEWRRRKRRRTKRIVRIAFWGSLWVWGGGGGGKGGWFCLGEV